MNTETIEVRIIFPNGSTRTKKYKTVRGVVNAVWQAVGSYPKIDPDGYLVGRGGTCVFVNGMSLNSVKVAQYLMDKDIPVRG